MADSTQDLMVRIRGDSSGVEQAAGRASKSIDGVNVSTNKATAAMRQFTNDLRNARDASDLVGAAASALSKILASSLAGTAVLLAGKILIDTFNKIKQTVDESKASIEKAMRDINAAGKTLNFAEAQAAANSLYNEIDKISQKTKEIEASKLQNFVASITGAKDEMAKLAAEAKRVADEILRQGIQSESASILIEASMTRVQKAARDAAEPFNALIEQARRLGDETLKAGLIATQQAEAAKAAALEQAKIDSELAEQKKKVDEEEAQRMAKAMEEERKFNEEKLEALIKENEKRTEAELEEQKIYENKKKRHIEDLQRSAERIGSIEAEIAKLREQGKAQAEQQAQVRGEEAKAGVGRIAGLGAGPQRKTSSEVGLERQLELGDIEGRRQRKSAALKDAERRLKEAGLPSDRIAQERLLKQDAREAARLKALGSGSKEIEKNNKAMAENESKISDLTKELELSKNSQKALNELDSQTKENFFDINKNAENLVDSFLGGKNSFDSTADSIEELDKKVADAAGVSSEKAPGAPGALATEATLQKVFDKLSDNLDELKTYAFIT